MLEIDLTSATFRDKLRGCWVGKNAGGTLGTPIEEAWGRDEPFDIWWYPELREGGLPNDDLEMQLVWLTALEQVGPGLKARDLARYWLDHIGYNWDEYGLSKTNLRLGLVPPVSGGFNNWFVDCMGCPIRSEVWACIAPGIPRLAAQYAYEDAICDHAGGESVYGELFNAAIQSAAFVVSDPRKLIDIGLSYVPKGSQTAKAVLAALRAVDEGLDWKAARRRVLEATPHHVAQFSPINMGFQVIGLLAGRDFGEALCITVNCGYDTDSSGGSIGSWWGIMAGDSNLPKKWTEPLGATISTNESWGGVRHLTDGTTPIPSTLPEIVDRLVAAAGTVLRAKGLLDGTMIRVSEESLYADDSVRELWTRDPLVVQFPEAQLTTAIRYDRTPAVVPGATAHVTTTLSNPHPDPIQATARIVVPTGWTAPLEQHISVPAASKADIEWLIPVPGRPVLENSNRLFMSVEVVGYPQEPATPIVLIGSAGMRITGTIPGAEGADEAALLEQKFEPEKGTNPSARGGNWTLISAEGNAVPAAALPEPGGVSYLQTFLYADEETNVTLGVDAGGPVKAWLNGDDLFSLNRYRPIRPSYGGSKDAYVDVPLRQGMNELLVKFARGAEGPTTECHILVSSADTLHHGLPQIGRTRFPWDR